MAFHGLPFPRDSKALALAEVHSKPALLRSCRVRCLQKDTRDGRKIIAAQAAVLVFGPRFCGSDDDKLVGRRARDSGKVPGWNEPGSPKHAIVEEGGQQITVAFGGEGLEPHIELNRLCGSHVEFGAALHLDRDDTPGRLIHDQQIGPVIIGDGLEGGELAARREHQADSNDGFAYRPDLGGCQPPLPLVAHGREQRLQEKTSQAECDSSSVDR